MGFMEEELARLPDGVEIVPTIEAERTIRERGGLLFVWPKISRGLLGTMTLLRTSTAVPVDALEYRRFQVGRILVFLSPRIRRLPKRLDLDTRGRHGRIKAYWDSCEFA